MELTINGINLYLIILVTFCVSASLMPVIKKLAVHVGAMDIPNARKVHSKPIPRMGGLGIFCAFLVGYMLFGQLSTQMISILIGGFLLVIIGMLDDIKEVQARYRFVIHIVSACIVVFYGGIYFTEVTLFGYLIEWHPLIMQLIAVFFIIAITNAINIIDGLDGLSSGISVIYFATIAIIAFILNLSGGLDVILSLIMIGSVLGYLLFNFHPASIFMGDGGSCFIGFMIAVISLLGFKAATLTSLIVPLLILAIPIVDTLLAMIRRIIKHRHIMEADKEHFHHQLLNMKFSTTKTVLIIYFINILFSAVSIFYVLGNNQLAITIYIILMIGLLYMVLNTTILYNKNNQTVIENVTDEIEDIVEESKKYNKKKKRKKKSKMKKKKR